MNNNQFQVNQANNANNPMPNGNGLPVTQVNNAGPNNLPPPPPPPPPAPAPPSAITTTAPNAKPEGNLVADWNGPGGSFSGYRIDEDFPFV